MAVYAAVAVFLGWQVWRVRHGLADSLSSVGWGAAAAAVGVTVMANFPGFFGWRLLVTRTCGRLAVTDAAWLYFLSGVTIYLPGAMWPTVTQATLARRVGVPATRLLGAGLVMMIMTAIGGTLVGLLALPQLVADSPRWWLMVPLVLCACAVMLAPPLLRRLIRLGQRLLRRGEREITLPTGRVSLAVIALGVLGWWCTGLHAAIVGIALGVPAASAMTLGIGGFALSAVAGGLSFAPAGLGVREAVLSLTFGVLLGGPDLVTLLLLSRAITTLGHVVATLGVLGLLAGIRRVKPSDTYRQVS
ncbi:lysylphosphatidylglycerol synthase domain-containing protein [Nonomuraea sp. ATR24]|uniref:lysylphosphatidylglycerol synthase domain-containing protein n=1 Tax=Nonomuraea sp. ATR24 TaxID=1676744 RepID=UPI0035BF0739